ncbi:MAG: hypothetical protein ACPHL6_10955 [Rubripirellula sp.]
MLKGRLTQWFDLCREWTPGQRQSRGNALLGLAWVISYVVVDSGVLAGILIGGLLFV